LRGKCRLQDSIVVSSRGLQLRLVDRLALDVKAAIALTFSWAAQKLRIVAVTASAVSFAFVTSPANSDPAANAPNLSLAAPGNINTIVPDGTCSAAFTVIGGGGGSSGGAGGTGGGGGASAQIKATFNVVPLQVVTGASAQGGQFNNATTAAVGITTLSGPGGTGFSKGGDSGATSVASSHRGAGGGGSSAVVIAGKTLIIAGGGGGGAAAHSNIPAGVAGNAGFTGITPGGVAAGASGSPGVGDATVGGGGGGTAVAGGAGGAHTTTLVGSAGSGIGVGTGGNGAADPNNDSGGGGGAGYTGGGGGASTTGSGAPNTGGGGGGGSSFLAATSPSATASAPTGVTGSVGGQAAGGVAALGPNGSVTIDWIPCQYSLVMAKTVSPTTINAGDKVVWTVSVTNSGLSSMTRGDTVTLIDTLPNTSISAMAPQFKVLSIGTSGGTTDANLDTGAFSCAGVTVGGVMPASTICSRPYSSSGSAGAPSGGLRGLNSGETLTVTYEEIFSNKSACTTVTNKASAIDRSTLSGTTDIIGVTANPNASAIETINCYDLGINKSVVPTNPVGGQTLTWKVIVNNAGPADMQGPVDTTSNPLIVTDAAPAANVSAPVNFTSTGPAGACTYTGGTITCPAGLASGQSQTFTFDQTVNAGTTGSTVIPNTASMVDFKVGGALNSSSASATVPTQAGIAVVKTAGAIQDFNGSGKLDAGDRIAFTFKVTNTGNVNLTGVGITDPKVPSITCVPTTLSAGAVANCTSAAPYTITQLDLDAGKTTNQATASAKDPGGVVISDLSDPASTATDAPTVVPLTQAPGVTVVKKATPSPFGAVGSTVAYTFDIKNTGNVTLNSIAISDPGLPGLSCTAPTTLAPGLTATATCTGNTVTVTQAMVDAGHLQNTVTVASKSPSGVSLPPAISTIDTAGPAAAPSMVLTKKATPSPFGPLGSTLTYSFDVKNTGNVTLKNVAVTDASLPTLSCTVADVAPATTVAATCTNNTVTVDQAMIDAGHLQNTATLNAKTPAGVVIPPVTSTIDTTGPVRAPAIALLKAVFAIADTNGSGGQNTGDTVTYTITVTNTGNVTLTNIIVTDPKPGVIVSGSPILTLAPGASDSSTIKATYVLTQADFDNGSTTNQAKVTASAPGGATATDLSDPLSNTGSAPTIVPVPLTPAMSLTKKATPSPFGAVGTTINYSFDVTNSGNISITNIAISDPVLPTLSCTSPVIAPGTTITATCTNNTLTVTQQMVDTGHQPNTATLNAKTVAGTSVVPVTSALDTPGPAQAPAVAIKKGVGTIADTNGNGMEDVGDIVSYIFTITNTGNVTLTNITASDSKPGVIVTGSPIVSLAPGAVDVTTYKATYILTQADVDAGSVANQAKVDATPPIGANVTDSSDPTSNAGNNPTVTPIVAMGSVAIVKNIGTIADTNTNGRVDVGDTVTYSITVTNTGNVTLTNLGVTDPKPGVTVSNPLIATLAPRATDSTPKATYILTQADLNAGLVDNQAKVVGSTPTLGVAVQDFSDPSSTAGNAHTITPVPQSQSVALRKAVGTIVDTNGNGMKDTGDTVNYVITVTNNGTVSLTNLIVADPKPGVTVTGSPIASLLPNAIDSTSVKASYVLTQADVDAGSVTNKANVSATIPSGGTITDQSDPLSDTGNADTVTPVPPNPSMTITKKATPSPFTIVGSNLVYSFDIKNTGNVTLSSVAVSDPSLPTLSCTTPSIAPGITITATCSGNTILVTQAMVDAGHIQNTASATAKQPDGTAVPPALPSTIDTLGPAQTPSIALVKSVGTIADTNNSGRQDVGDTVTYVMSVTNTGNVTLTGITVTDPKPGVIVKGGPIASLAPTLSDNTTFVASYVLTQIDIDAGTVRNQAAASGQPPSGPLVSDQSDPTSKTGNLQTDTPITLVPSITMIKPVGVIADTNNNKRQDVDDIVSYTITVKNTGNVTLNGIMVNDPKPGASVTGSPIASLAPGDSDSSVKVSYKLTQPDVDAGVVVNQAVVSGNPPTGPPVGDFSDPASGTLNNKTNTPITPTSGMTLKKTASPSPFGVVGSQITYSFDITNNGNVTLSNFSISDVLLPSLSCSSAPIAPSNTATTICTGMNLTVDQTMVDAGVVTNTATVNAKTPAGLSVAPANGSATDNGPAQSPSIALLKAVGIINDANGSGRDDPGDTLTYKLTVTNTGNVTLSNLVFSDPKPGATVSGSPVASLAPTKSDSTVTVTYPLTQADIDAGQVSNKAAVTATSPKGIAVGDKSDPVDPAADNPTITPLKPMPSIALIKLPGKLNDTNKDGIAEAGETLIYQLIVTNTGNVTLSSISATDSLAGAVINGGPITSLAPGAVDKTTLTAVYTIKQTDIDAGSISNSATASGAPPPISGLPSSVSDVSDAASNGGSAPTPTPIIKVPNLALVKAVTSNADEDQSGFVTVNDTLTYTVTATNTGNVTLTNVQVTDNKIVPGSQTCPTVLPGKTCTLVGAYKVNAADITAGEVKNIAAASASQLSTPITAEITTKAYPPFDPGNFSKIARKRMVARGERVTFDIQALDIHLDPARIIDTIPPGFDYVPHTAKINGLPVSPTINGRVLTFDNLSPDQDNKLLLQVTLVATATVDAGDYVNKAQLVAPSTGRVLAAAQATVSIKLEHVFDCGEIIGKVFDDKNRNGYQDQDEPGIAGVRLSTIKGTLITTDKFGRYHISCADVPDQDIGSNFYVKLDTRTLPSGFRLISENPATVRLTRGKITKLDFGGSISRVMKIQLSKNAFVTGQADLLEKWQTKIDTILNALLEEPSTLRVIYFAANGEDPGLARARLNNFQSLVAKRWGEGRALYKLPIETQIIKSQGAAQ
jgi:uncharacterized repeat protein (TIGR01451 family)